MDTDEEVDGHRYFFFTDDGDLRLEDDIGVVLAGPDEARQMALDALPDMARDKIPDGNQRTFCVSVQDDDKDVIFVATLSLKAEWRKKRTAAHLQA